MINPEVCKKIEKAIIFLVKEYSESGYNSKPVVFHSLDIAFYLLERGYSPTIICAALLHDLVEDSNVELEKIESVFGKDVANIVQAVTFEGSINDKEKQYKELFSRTLKAGRDALAVKCADIQSNSLYINLIADKKKEIFLLNKIKYFLALSKTKIGNEEIWKNLAGRVKEEEVRISKKYKTKL